jgi:hypothetical protein
MNSGMQVETRRVLECSGQHAIVQSHLPRFPCTRQVPLPKLRSRVFGSNVDR